MKDKDKDYLISAGVLIFVGWFCFAIICSSVALVLLNKVENKSTIKIILQILAFVELVVVVINFSN